MPSPSAPAPADAAVTLPWLLPGRPLARAVVAVLLIAALAQQLVSTALHMVVDINMHFGYLSTVWFVVLFTAAWLLLPGLLHVWRTGDARGRRVGVVLVSLALGGHWAWLRMGILSWDFRLDRSPGHFPFEGGTVREEDRQGWHMVAHILPDGSRSCGSGAEGPTVVMVGDSFVFGSGLVDEDTLCWKLREALAAEGRTVRLINLGQPGASIHSYVDTLRYGVETWKPALVMMSILPFDDLRPFDLNNQRVVVHHPLFQLLAAAWDPELMWTALAMVYEVMPPDFWFTLSGRWGIDKVAEVAAELDVPVLIEVIAHDNERGALAAQVSMLEEAVEASDVLRLFPVSYWPAEQGGQPLYIPGDGHPTGAGNAARARELLPVVRQLLAGEGR